MKRANHHGMGYDQKTTGGCYVCVWTTYGKDGGRVTGVHRCIGDAISELLGENLLQYLAITEYKIDNSFPDSQFSVPNFTLYRRARNQHGGGVLTCIRSDVPNRRLTDIDTNDLEIIVNEITIQKVK